MKQITSSVHVSAAGLIEQPSGNSGGYVSGVRKIKGDAPDHILAWKAKKFRMRRFRAAGGALHILGGMALSLAPAIPLMYASVNLCPGESELIPEGVFHKRVQPGVLSLAAEAPDRPIPPRDPARDPALSGLVVSDLSKFRDWDA